MLCRLCLYEFNDLFSIFNDDGELIAEDIIKSIIKYLEIELQQNDDISTKICKECWHQLDSFNNFCKNIAQKQSDFQSQIKANQIVIEEKHILCESATKFENVDNLSLCEPQIDINETIDKTEDQLNDTELGNTFSAEENSDIDNESNNVMYDSTNSLTEPTLLNKQRKKYNTRQKKSGTKVLRKNKNVKGTSALPIADSARKLKLREMGMEMDAYIAEHIELSCCICKKTLANFTQLKTHFRKEHGCVGYVPCCNNRYKKRSRLVEHLKVHKDPNYFKCTICEKVLISRNSYNNHMDTMHPTEEQLKFQCSVCSEKFTKQYILDIHMNKHHGEQQELKCEVCHKLYRSAGSLRDHMSNVHLNLTQKICDLCGQVLRSKQGLTYHMRSIHHIGEQKEMQCKICGKWLKNERCYYKHKYNHQDEASTKKFTCSVCGIEKSTRTKLSCHVRYHHSENKYNCVFCNKQLKSKVSLNEHEATHTGNDLYSCSFCPRTFKSHANMYNHKKKVHADQFIPRNSQPTEQENKIENLPEVDINVENR